MSGLLDAVLAAHGGLDRWREFSTIEATIISGGKLWEIKGQPQDPTPRRMTVALQHEWASVQPFGAADQKSDFTPQRIAIEKLDGRVVSERVNPRDSFAGHELTTPWDPLQRAYFNGYALWTYLTTPFLMTSPEFTVNEIDPVEDPASAGMDYERNFRTGTPATATCRSSTSAGTSAAPPRLPRRRRRRIRRDPIRLRHGGGRRNPPAVQAPRVPLRRRWSAHARRAHGVNRHQRRSSDMRSSRSVRVGWLVSVRRH